MIVLYGRSGVGRRVAGALPPAPGWVTAAVANGWDVGTWAQISGSSPSHSLSATNVVTDVKSVASNLELFQGILKNWCGGSFAPDLGNFGTYIIGPGGGHGGYPNNEVFGFDIETRTWSELWPDTTVGDTLDATFGEWSDGSPSAYHTYFEPAATPALSGYASGIYILPKSVNSTAGQTPDVATPYPHFLDLANPGNGWTRLDAIPSNDTRTSWKSAPAGIWDSSRSRYQYWCQTVSHSANLFAALDPLASVGSQWTEQNPENAAGGHGIGAGNGIEQVLFIEPSLDILVRLDWRNTLDRIDYVKLSDPTAFYTNSNTLWPITETGTGPSSKTEGGGFDWSPSREAAIWWGGATTAAVYQLKLDSGSVGSSGVAGDLTYAWSSLLDAGNAITPATQDGQDEKIYNRFRIVTCGDYEFAVALTHVDGPVYAFRLK